MGTIIVLMSPILNLKVSLLLSLIVISSTNFLNKYGSNEYKTQKGIERQNFIIATNNYYNKDLKKVKIHTLLYYGKLDKVTPLKEGRYIKRKMLNSKLIIDENGDHFAMYSNPYKFIRSLKEFIND